jgi:PKHD-type hydroxylase
MTKCDQVYYIPSAIDESVAKVITDQLFDCQLDDGVVINGEDDPNNPLRISKIHWLNTDHWVAGMMAHFIHQANNNTFQYDLHAWSDQIQYTVYDSVGSKYGWHTDQCPSTYYEGMWRKLSISLCLTSDYEGGKFQILGGHNKLVNYNLRCGDAVIFSSDLVHRVTPVKSGKRISLVGWFAGPKFK